MTQRGMAALAAAILAAACAGEKPAGGNVQVRIDAITYRYEITRISLDIQPAGIQQDLAYDAYSGTFSGFLLVPAGMQTLTATAYSQDHVVGVGTAVVEIVGGTTAYVSITIRDTTGPPPMPDHTPIITSFVVPTTTPYVDQTVTLAATAIDPDGDPLAYQWSQSCATGTFSDPTSPVTDWRSSAAGTCTLTLVVSSKGLADVASATVYVTDANTGTLQVSGSYVANPTVQSIAVQSYGSYRTFYRWDPNIDAGAYPLGEPVSVAFSFDLGTYTPGSFQPLLTDNCGGRSTLAFWSNGYASFSWTPPAGPSVCVLTATIDHVGLRDSMPVVLTIEPCSGTLQCSPWSTCDAGTCRSQRQVWGHVQTTYWDGTNPTITLPSPDVPSLSVEALVPQPGGGFASYAGWIDPGSGYFNVFGVPSGRYLLSLTRSRDGYRTLVDTSNDYLDLGRDELGRPYKSYPSGPTPVTFQASDLEPWAAGDQLQYTSMGAGVWDVPSDRWLIADGATDVLQEEDWLNNLVDAGQGDVLYVHQLGQREVPSMPGLPYLTAVAAQALSVTIADLVPATIAAVLSPVDQTGTLDADWFTSGFEAHLPDMGPAGVAASVHALYVDATPGTTWYPSPLPPYGWPDLLAWTLAPGTPDLSTGPLAYGQFLPGWNEFRFAGFYASTQRTAPGASAPRDLSSAIGAFEPLPAGRALQPKLSPVRAPAVAGMDLTGGDVAGAGFAPVLSWTEPAIGLADRYVASVYELYARPDGRTGLRSVGMAYTRSTSVALPLAFQPGAWYFARITAYAEPGSNVESSPFRSSYTNLAYASRITAVWTP